ncbi:DUF6783 domain-containing protein [Clostridium sp. MCC353]|uniref:DUF6783 domain-containing protein n=1 Tax=Clostridium sp. MCC353 TaxID=2592646 RepID=UPI0031FE763B
MKIHFRHLHAPLCGIFGPNSGYIARYAPFIWPKSPTNCDAQLPESNFQTRSSFPILFRFKMCRGEAQRRIMKRRHLK